jgi:hypothetical protein
MQNIDSLREMITFVKFSLAGSLIIGFSLLIIIVIKFVFSKELPRITWFLCLVGIFLIGLPIWERVTFKGPGGFVFDAKVVDAFGAVGKVVETVANNNNVSIKQIDQLVKTLAEKQVIKETELKSINEQIKQLKTIDLQELKTATSTLENLTKQIQIKINQ